MYADLFLNVLRTRRLAKFPGTAPLHRTFLPFTDRVKVELAPVRAVNIRQMPRISVRYRRQGDPFAGTLAEILAGILPCKIASRPQIGRVVGYHWEMTSSNYHHRHGNVQPVGKRPAGVRLSGSDDEETDPEGGLATAAAKPKLKRPPMYKVVLLNDDYTPMEFVVHVLEVFFSMDREKATQIMLTVHTQGAAVVGIFPRDIAETKSEQVNQYAQENQHPLISTVEMTD